MKNKIVHHIKRLCKKNRVYDDSFMQNLINSSINYYYDLIGVGYSDYSSYKMVIRKVKKLITVNQQPNYTIKLIVINTIQLLLILMNYILFFPLRLSLDVIFIFDCMTSLLMILICLVFIKDLSIKKKILHLGVVVVIDAILCNILCRYFNRFLSISFILLFSNIIWVLLERVGKRFLLVTIPSFVICLIVSFPYIFRIRDIDILLLVMVFSFLYIFQTINLNSQDNFIMFVLALCFSVFLYAINVYDSAIHYLVLGFLAVSFYTIKRVGKLVTKEDVRTTTSLILFALIIYNFFKIGYGIKHGLRNISIENSDILSVLICFEIFEIVLAMWIKSNILYEKKP